MPWEKSGGNTRDVLNVCQQCSERRGNRCRLANQIVSILARTPGATCPIGRWDKPSRCANKIEAERGDPNKIRAGQTKHYHLGNRTHRPRCDHRHFRLPSARLRGTAGEIHPPILSDHANHHRRQWRPTRKRGGRSSDLSAVAVQHRLVGHAEPDRRCAANPVFVAVG